MKENIKETPTACALCIHSCNNPDPSCAHPKAEIRMAFGIDDYTCSGFTLDLTSSSMVTIEGVKIFADADKLQLVDALWWLAGSSDRFIGDHDWDSDDNEGLNDDSLRWMRGLKEAGAIEIMVDNEERDSNGHESNYRTGLVVKVRAVDIIKLMDVMCYLAALQSDELNYGYNPEAAIFTISLAWIS